MNLFKKILLFTLSFVPISAISYAVEYNQSIHPLDMSQIDIDGEFFDRLNSGNLSRRYYNLLEEFEIYSIQEFYSDGNKQARGFIMDVFRSEYKDSLFMGSGTRSYDKIP